jgi:hypothetical protein
MKLYATTTSERGKPSEKAGNDYINITLTENRENRFEITFTGEEMQVLNYCTGDKLYMPYCVGSKYITDISYPPSKIKYKM